MTKYDVATPQIPVWSFLQSIRIYRLLYLSSEPELIATARDNASKSIWSWFILICSVRKIFDQKSLKSWSWGLTFGILFRIGVSWATCNRSKFLNSSIILSNSRFWNFLFSRLQVRFNCNYISFLLLESRVHRLSFMRCLISLFSQGLLSVWFSVVLHTWAHDWIATSTSCKLCISCKAK